MLPLGRRVQDKLEKLIDKYMAKLGQGKYPFPSFFKLTNGRLLESRFIINIFRKVMGTKWAARFSGLRSMPFIFYARSC